MTSSPDPDGKQSARSELAGEAPLSELTTRRLVARGGDGDPRAIDELCRRYLPRLEQWATHRLPQWARFRADTEDIAQDVMIQTIGRLEDLELIQPSDFPRYLQASVTYRILREIRDAKLRQDPHRQSRIPVPPAPPTPLDVVLGEETVQRIQDALDRLRPRDRWLIFLRLEMGLAEEMSLGGE